MEDYQIFIVVFSSMSTVFLCCALPTLSKTCISSPSVSPSLIQNNNNKYNIKNIIKHIKKIKNIKKIRYLPEEQATNECVQKGLTGIRTQIKGFKVLGANRYTIRPGPINFLLYITIQILI